MRKAKAKGRYVENGD